MHALLTVPCSFAMWAARRAGWARPKPDALLPASRPSFFRRQSSPVVPRQRPPGIETQDVDTAPILPFSPDAGPDEELPRHDVRVVLIAPRRCLSDAAVSSPDGRCGLKVDGENDGERCSEMDGAAEGEADSPVIKTKKKKKKKAKSPANRARSISPRIRSLESPASSTTSDNISSPLDPQSPLSDATFKPAKTNAKSVGFAGVCEDGAPSTKWKLVVDKNRTAGSGQVSCECNFQAVVLLTLSPDPVLLPPARFRLLALAACQTVRPLGSKDLHLVKDAHEIGDSEFGRGQVQNGQPRVFNLCPWWR